MAGRPLRRARSKATQVTPSSAAIKSANIVLEALATAFGGWSQFPDTVIGEAIFGHFNNSGNATSGGVSPDEVMEAAALLTSERWHEFTEFDLTLNNIRRGFAAAQRSVARFENK